MAGEVGVRAREKRKGRKDKRKEGGWRKDNKDKGERRKGAGENSLLNRGA